MATIQQLRADAISRTFFKPTTLRSALGKLGFVQADPIRSPARAQDLILRHRVKDYRAGQLEQRYPKLDIEEDFLYAYGFLPRDNWRLLHPRDTSGLSPLESRVLGVANHYGRMHPRELEAHLGRERTINAWGGYSKATTQALHRLHYRGLLRVAGRENGIRIYEPTVALVHDLSPEERLKRVTLLIAGIFAPTPLVSLRSVLRFLTHSAPSLDLRSRPIEALLGTGELVSAEVEGLRYIWPGRLKRYQADDEVRFLAPFDPLVWNRRRFEHLWGWRYRFEAYTPAPKRVMGYYAMPVLWRDALIGWANASSKAGLLDVKLHYVESQPKEKLFLKAVDREIERLRVFLDGELSR